MSQATTTSIVTLVGSLRADSVNKKFAQVAARVAPQVGAEATVFDQLGDLPFYSEDLDTPDGAPALAQQLREAVGQADALLLVTPEYNGGLPAVLKNAIDWLSRPYGANALAQTPVAVIGAAAGQYGGMWAHDDARKSVGIAGGVPLAEVAFSVANAGGRFGSTHPADDVEVVENVTRVIEAIVAAVPVEDAA